MNPLLKEYSEILKKDKKARLKLLIVDILSSFNPTRGDKGDQGEQGEKGIDGRNGKTPVKGLDYMTSKEIEEIREIIRPKKGVDYFTTEEVRSIIALASEKALKELPNIQEIKTALNEGIAKALEGVEKPLSTKDVERIVYQMISGLRIPVPATPSLLWGTILGTITDQTDLINYINNELVGVLNDRGNYDASVNTYPATGGSGTAGAIRKGDLWFISVAGTLGGVAVQIGDTIRALSNAPGQTSSNWSVMETNFSYTPENSANKDISTSLGTSDTKYPSQKAVKTYVDTGLGTKENSLGFTPENAANKAVNLATSNDTLYPTVKAVNDGLAGKQASGSYEVTANKENTTLDTSTSKYPTNNLVKVSIDNALALAVLLAGRAGGQVIYGGTGAGENLELRSTSNATKGKIYIAKTSEVAPDSYANNVGSGTFALRYALWTGSAPEEREFRIVATPSTGARNGNIFFQDNSGTNWLSLAFGASTSLISFFQPLITQTSQSATSPSLSNYHALLYNTNSTVNNLTSIINRNQGAMATGTIAFRNVSHSATVGSADLLFYLSNAGAQDLKWSMLADGTFKAMQIGASATGYADQRSSNILNFESAMWNGSSAVAGNFSLQSIPTTVSNSTTFTLKYGATTLLTLTSGGSFTITGTIVGQVGDATTASIPATAIRSRNTNTGANTWTGFTSYNSSNVPVGGFFTQQMTVSATVPVADMIIATVNGSLTMTERMRITGAGVVNIASGGVIQIAGTQVVGARVVDARCDDAINSGDATTDGVIDALRDAMIAHGLISAS